MLIVNHQISHRSTLKSFRITHLVNASPCRAPHPGDSTWPWAEQPFERAIFCHPFPAGKKPMENPGPGIGSCWIRKDGLLVGHELRPEDWEAVEDTLKVLCGWSSSWWHRQTSARLSILSTKQARPFFLSKPLLFSSFLQGISGNTLHHLINPRRATLAQRIGWKNPRLTGETSTARNAAAVVRLHWDFVFFFRWWWWIWTLRILQARVGKQHMNSA